MAESLQEPWEGKIRYAVVGLGHIAQSAVLPAFEHVKVNSVLTALISDNYEKLEALSKRYGASATYAYDQYDACLRSGNVDAVYIALPNHMHRDFAVRAAEAGVHVLCEKPMAVTEEDCEAMIRAADQNHIKLMIAYRLHFEAANLSTVELARSGKLGELRIFDSVFSIDVRDANNIRLSPQHMGGGTVYDLGIYCINAARYLFGDEPEAVTAVSASRDDPRFRNSDEMTSAILRFPGDRIATFTSSFGAVDVSQYRLVGTLGEVRLEPAYEYAQSLRQYITLDGNTEQRELGRRDQFAPELSYFSSCIQHGREPEPSGWEGLADVRVIRAIYESARTGRTVQLPPFTRARRPSMDQQIELPAVDEPTEIHARSPHG